MKKAMKFAIATLSLATIFSACGDKGKEPPKKSGLKPPCTLTQPLVSGAVRAGLPAQIVIGGEGFLPDEDYIYAGYKDGDEIVYERISPEHLEITSKRISFGVNVGASFIDKSVRVYLDRSGYDTRLELSDDITFTLPSVAEGYIPDPAFRSTLSSASLDEGNPEIAKLFNSYGMIDPAAAAKIQKCGAKDYGLNLYGCRATSLEGIELFSSVEGVIAAWKIPLLKEANFSGWKAKGIDLRFHDAPMLEKFTGAPYAYRTDLYKSPNLTYVDLSPSKWCYNIQLFFDESSTKYSSVNHLDIRRQRTGTAFTGDENGDYPKDPDTDYAIVLPGAWMKVASGCTILVDYQFLLDKRGAPEESGSGYATIYSAWKRGATIEVYDSTDISKKIGTVPMYSVEPGALTLPGSDNGWTPNS